MELQGAADHTLNIDNVTRDYNGMTIRCQATNPAGSDSLTFHLDIICELVFINQYLIFQRFTLSV